MTFGALALAIGATAGTPLRGQDEGTQQAKSNDLAESILGARLRFSDGQVIVSHVKRGGAAERAGVRPGDTLQSIEKHKIASLQDVVKVLQHFKPGHGIVMNVVPKAGPRQLYVTPAAPTSGMSPSGRAMLGANLSDASGAVVAGELSMGGPAIVAGLRSGDRLVAFNGKPIKSRAQLLGLVNDCRPGDRVDLTIQRAGWQRSLVVTLAARDQVAALPKMLVPSQAEGQANAPAAADSQVQPDGWVDEQRAEDLYNVNDRALYTDFD
ncbi:MAG: PDZ domain-containing protein [Planctomycetia bacterium]|nr:PDZ domain-containing protein [Planctomycetia bacterium]